MNSMHDVTHGVSFIIIVILISLHLQLQSEYEALKDNCACQTEILPRQGYTLYSETAAKNQHFYSRKAQEFMTTSSSQLRNDHQSVSSEEHVLFHSEPSPLSGREVYGEETSHVAISWSDFRIKSSNFETNIKAETKVTDPLVGLSTGNVDNEVVTETPSIALSENVQLETKKVELMNKPEKTQAGFEQIVDSSQQQQPSVLSSWTEKQELYDHKIPSVGYNQHEKTDLNHGNGHSQETDLEVSVPHIKPTSARASAFDTSSKREASVSSMSSRKAGEQIQGDLKLQKDVYGSTDYLTERNQITGVEDLTVIMDHDQNVERAPKAFQNGHYAETDGLEGEWNYFYQTEIWSLENAEVGINDFESDEYDDEDSFDSYDVEQKLTFPKSMRVDKKPAWKLSDDATVEKFVSEGTSMKCQNADDTERICTFDNLCYNTKERDFVFLKGSKSRIESDSGEFDSEVLTINLSSVPGHNAHKFTIVTIPAEALHQFSVAVVDKTVIPFSRFKPDNIMHVLHDDILPLYHTLYSRRFQVTNKMFDVALAITDVHDSGDFIHLYSSLFTVAPVILWKLNNTADMICFPSAHLGVSNATLWYQYGFFEPQGPLNEVITRTAGENIQRATDHLSDLFKTECWLCGRGNHLVFLSRKDNRLILNEGELIMALARSTKLKIVSVSLETHRLPEIISMVRASKGVIGMHGSLLSLSVFLQPGSIVVELFPYAVNPLKYTPFQSVLNLLGSEYVYKSWANPDKDSTVAHPDHSPGLGGISHLPGDLQDEILAQSEVPDHLCCEDPSWLYHIYQDTRVNVSAVAGLASQALLEAKVDEPQLPTPATPASVVYPGPVRKLECLFEESNYVLAKQVSFILQWHSPWNTDFIVYDTLEYEVVVVDKNSEHKLMDVTTSETYFMLYSERISKDNEYNVWVRTVMDKGLNSPYIFVQCSAHR